MIANCLVMHIVEPFSGCAGTVHLPVFPQLPFASGTPQVHLGVQTVRWNVVCSQHTAFLRCTLSCFQHCGACAFLCTCLKRRDKIWLQGRFQTQLAFSTYCQLTRSWWRENSSTKRKQSLDTEFGSGQGERKRKNYMLKFLRCLMYSTLLLSQFVERKDEPDVCIRG